MERRDKERYRVWFPMTVVTAAGHEGTAITYDVSSGGLLMACPGSLDVGAKVTLRFKIEAEDEERVIPASVLRLEPGGDAPWRFRMAVKFEQPHPELEALLAQHAEPSSSD